MAQILVELESRQGLFESAELVVGSRSFTQVLDSLNVLFHCSRCHHVGHIMVDCDRKFSKKFQGSPKAEVRGFPVTSSFPNEARVFLKPFVPSTSRDGLALLLEPGNDNKTTSQSDFNVGDIVIPLEDVVPGKEESRNPRDLFGDNLDITPSQWSMIDTL